MIKNYFKTAWRILWRNKVFSAINILGLSTGLACCILMFLFIQHELSYDKFNVNAENIYRVTSIPVEGKERKELAVAPPPWAPAMKKEFPEVKEYVRLLKDPNAVAGSPGEQHFYEKGIVYADSTLFNVFSIALERGDKTKPLDRPNTAVLTREAAQKYFGNTDPIGKTLEVNSFGRNLNVEVTAIAEPMPATSHFKFQVLISLQSFGDLSGMWAFHMCQSYLLLDDKTSAKKVEQKLVGFVDKYIANNTQADGKHDIFLQPLTGIHLHSNMVGELDVNGDITYVYVFAGVALFILLIACFNFINLSTIRSVVRAKEIGLRKVVGASKSQLLKQFLGEAVFFAIISLMAAVIIAFVVLPVFNQLSGRDISLNFKNNPSLIAVLALLVLFIGLIAGLYPAIVLASFRPVQVLKGKILSNRKGIFRKALVTLQFVVSIALIASTIVVNRQLNFLQNKKIGFDKENVVVLTLPRNTDSATMETFRNSLNSDPAIRSVGASSSIPGTYIPVNQINDGSADLTKALSMQMLFTDHDFIRTMNMKVVAGRDFSRNFPTDQYAGFVLNEEAVKQLGWTSPAAAIGKTVQWVIPGTVIKSGRVVGVVRDFNITPLKTAIQPLVMHILPSRYNYLYIRFDQSKNAHALGTIESAFRQSFAKQSFEYNFLDDTLASMYQSEKKLGLIFSYFSFLAIVIACLGVLGLSLYSIQQRIREIGIRKVIGASVSSITGLLLKEFIKPVLMASVIAVPVVWYGMHSWLQEFAYRINIGWQVFLVAAVVAVMIALITVSFQAIKAAIANPVKSLRTE